MIGSAFGKLCGSKCQWTRAGDRPAHAFIRESSSCWDHVLVGLGDGTSRHSIGRGGEGQFLNVVAADLGTSFRFICAEEIFERGNAAGR